MKHRKRASTAKGRKEHKGARGRRKTGVKRSKTARRYLRRRRRPAVPPPLPPVPLSPEPDAAEAAASLAAVNEAYDRGYDKGYGKGYKAGAYDGGDRLADLNMPPGFILPHIDVERMIAAGIQQFSGEYVPVLGTSDIVELMVRSMDRREPCSIVRLGDGELLTMAQEVVYPPEYIREEGAFLEYAGVQIPDLAARDQLAAAVRGSTAIGVPLLRVPNFQPLAYKVFSAYGMNMKEMKLTHSTINYAIYLEHGLKQICSGRSVLLIGNKAPELANVLAAAGVRISGTISPVNGVADVQRVMEEAASCDFELALVSAGIAAVILCHRLASEYGKTALDFGHLADSMISGDAPFVQ